MSVNDKHNQSSGDVNDPLLQKVVEQLDEQALSLDAETVSHLNQARINAVAASQSSKVNASIAVKKWIAVPFGAVAASVLTLMVVLQFDGTGNNDIPMAGLESGMDAVLAIDSSDATSLSAEEVELIASTDELEFYQGIAFIEWLDQVEADTLQPVGWKSSQEVDSGRNNLAGKPV